MLQVFYIFILLKLMCHAPNTLLHHWIKLVSLLRTVYCLRHRLRLLYFAFLAVFRIIVKNWLRLFYRSWLQLILRCCLYLLANLSYWFRLTSSSNSIWITYLSEIFYVILILRFLCFFWSFAFASSTWWRSVWVWSFWTACNLYLHCLRFILTYRPLFWGCLRAWELWFSLVIWFVLFHYSLYSVFTLISRMVWYSSKLFDCLWRSSLLLRQFSISLIISMGISSCWLLMAWLFTSWWLFTFVWLFTATLLFKIRLYILNVIYVFFQSILNIFLCNSLVLTNIAAGRRINLLVSPSTSFLIGVLLVCSPREILIGLKFYAVWLTRLKDFSNLLWNCWLWWGVIRFFSFWCGKFF